jgi:predicted DNA-binding protein (MmcQ/YjbR family)
MAKVKNGFEAELRAYALGFPGAYEEFPWGERAIKVKKKIFVFMSNNEAVLSLTTKLPASKGEALSMDFTEPTHYGLGKSGWVTSSFAAGMKPPMEYLRDWIEESYRAVAPKTLVKQHLASLHAPAKKPAKKRAKKKAAARR